MESFRFMRIVTMVLAVAALCGGCATPIGNTRMPEPTSAVEPKKEYKASADAVWKAIHDAFDNNRIFVATENKSEGRISTEYIAGQSQMNALGLLGTISTRYKYQIRMTQAGNGMTQIAVTCVLESSGNAMQAWRDISKDNMQIVANLEKWLYQEIEKEAAKMSSVATPEAKPSTNQNASKVAPSGSTKRSVPKKSTQGAQ
jgi:hypothetical protein